MTLDREFHGPNLAYVLDLYDQYRNDPDAVDQAARKYFEELKPAGLSKADLQTLMGTINLAHAIRSHGYLAAKLDPLGSSGMDDRLLTFEFHRLREEDLRGLPASVVNVFGRQGGEDAQQAIQTLRSIYSNTIGYD